MGQERACPLPARQLRKYRRAQERLLTTALCSVGCPWAQVRSCPARLLRRAPRCEWLHPVLLSGLPSTCGINHHQALICCHRIPGSTDYATQSQLGCMSALNPVQQQCCAGAAAFQDDHRDLLMPSGIQVRQALSHESCRKNHQHIAPAGAP